MSTIGTKRRFLDAGCSVAIRGETETFLSPALSRYDADGVKCPKVIILEEHTMRDLTRSLSVAFIMALFVAIPVSAAENSKQHRVAMHVDQNDLDVMNLALNNAKNVIEHYQKRGEDIVIEIVAYSGGLHMLRSDTSQVKDRIKEMVGKYATRIKFAACNNTIQGMEKREGHAISIIPEAIIVSAGVVELVELQEQGWSYIRP